MTSPDMDRQVAGIRCRQVLERLSDYLEGELAPELVGRVDAHLAACDRCERFGGEVGEVVAALRRELARPESLRPGVEARLRARLARAR